MWFRLIILYVPYRTLHIFRWANPRYHILAHCLPPVEKGDQKDLKYELDTFNTAEYTSLKEKKNVITCCLYISLTFKKQLTTLIHMNVLIYCE